MHDKYHQKLLKCIADNANLPASEAASISKDTSFGNGYPLTAQNIEDLIPLYKERYPDMRMPRQWRRQPSPSGSNGVMCSTLIHMRARSTYARPLRYRL